jgi:hypothetical protein
MSCRCCASSKYAFLYIIYLYCFSCILSSEVCVFAKKGYTIFKSLFHIGLSQSATNGTTVIVSSFSKLFLHNMIINNYTLGVCMYCNGFEILYILYAGKADLTDLSWVKYFTRRNLLKSMKFVLKMSYLKIIMNKLCMGSCVSYYRTRKVVLSQNDTIYCDHL